MAGLSPEMLQRLSMLLGQRHTPGVQPDSPFMPSRQRGREAMGLPNDASPPQPVGTPSYQLPNTGQNTAGLPAYGQPGSMLPSMAQYMRPAASPTPPVTVQASPPPVIPPGDQPLPTTMTQSATAADAANPMGGPNTPGFWERINQALKAQQIPDGYRGAMGEMIKNG